MPKFLPESFGFWLISAWNNTCQTDLDHKESWVPKNWCFRTVVLENTLESPLDCKEIKPVSSKGNQPLIFIGRSDAEAETPILWPLDVKNWLIGKDPDSGKDWREEEKGMTEDEIVGWYYWLNGTEFEQAPWAGDGQGSLTCCSPWSRRVGPDWATELNWRKGEISVVMGKIWQCSLRKWLWFTDRSCRIWE